MEYTAIYAVKEAGRILSQMFFHMEDEYMRARSADVLDISDMLIKILSGQKQLEVTTLILLNASYTATLLNNQHHTPVKPSYSYKLSLI